MNSFTIITKKNVVSKILLNLSKNRENTITRIGIEENISTSSRVRKLDKLLRLKLIQLRIPPKKEKRGNTKYYSLTEKGKEFVVYINKIFRLQNEI